MVQLLVQFLQVQLRKVYMHQVQLQQLKIQQVLRSALVNPTPKLMQFQLLLHPWVLLETYQTRPLMQQESQVTWQVL